MSEKMPEKDEFATTTNINDPKHVWITDEQKFWWDRLAYRTKRLHKLATLKAPPFIIMTEIELVLKATAAINPDSVGKRIGQVLQQSARRSCGLCTLCGKPVNDVSFAETGSSHEWCADCEAEIKQMAED